MRLLKFLSLALIGLLLALLVRLPAAVDGQGAGKPPSPDATGSSAH